MHLPCQKVIIPIFIKPFYHRRIREISQERIPPKIKRNGQQAADRYLLVKGTWLSLPTEE
jgi:hypothetical protein